MLKYTTRIIPCSGFAVRQSHIRSRNADNGYQRAALLQVRYAIRYPEAIDGLRQKALGLRPEANANEQKLIDTMDKLLIQNQAPVEQFKRLTKSFNEYKSRKPKTFKI